MESAAEFFWNVRAGGPVPKTIPPEASPGTLAEAYRAQADLVDRILAAAGGGTRVGYKIACTSVAAQRMLRTGHPVYARLLSTHVWPSGARFSARTLPMLAAEPEFAFRIAKDVPQSDASWDRESILPFVGEMMPGLELVGHRFPEWSAYSAPTLAADNGISQGWVYGAPTDAWRALDLAAHAVSLQANGERRLDGSGSIVLGHPMNAVAWLANALPAHGLRLREGDLVTTGTCTDVYFSGAGETVHADFGVLGSVELTFDP